MVFPSLNISPYIMINQKKYIHFIETNIYRKAYPSKRKTIEKWTRIVGKGEKRSGTVKKDYHWIETERLSLNWDRELWGFTNWTWHFEWKLFQNKKKVCSCLTVNGDITDLANASVLLYLNCFYYQANLKLINSLKFAYYWKQKKQIHF